MCKAIEEMMNDSKLAGRTEGRTEGRAKGRVEALAGLVKDGLISAKDAAARLNMTEDEFKAAMSRLV